MKLTNKSTLLERVFRTLKDDEQLSPSIRYGSYVILHKICVGKAMLWNGLSLRRAIIHDWQKFHPTKEFKQYTDTFYRGETPRRADGGYDPNAVSEEFTRAWWHHLKHSRHHWQNWVMVNDDGSITPLEMPEKDRLEMVSDFMGAGRGIAGTWNPTQWYQANKDKLILHPTTRQKIEDDLEDLDLIFKET